MRKPQAILTLSALLFSLAALPAISAQHTFAKFTAANISSAIIIPSTLAVKRLGSTACLQTPPVKRERRRGFWLLKTTGQAVRR